MRFAYFIIAHAQPRQLEWLTRAIADPQDLILVHINSRTDAQTASALRTAARSASEVVFLPQRPIGWGGWNLAAVDLDAMSFAVQSDRPWDYFINLSGQDYPIKPITEMRRVLAGAPGANYLEIRRIRDLAFHFRLRSLVRHMEVGGKPVRTPIPNLAPRPVDELYHGLKWGIFSREFCEWLTADGEKLEKAEAYFSQTKIPDESLLQSLFMASPFRDTLIADHKRLVDFEGGKPNPRAFTMADWELLTGSPAFFARKFDETLDPELMRRMAERIGASEPGRP